MLLCWVHGVVATTCMGPVYKASQLIFDYTLNTRARSVTSKLLYLAPAERLQHSPV